MTFVVYRPSPESWFNSTWSTDPSHVLLIFSNDDGNLPVGFFTVEVFLGSRVSQGHAESGVSINRVWHIRDVDETCAVDVWDLLPLLRNWDERFLTYLIATLHHRFVSSESVSPSLNRPSWRYYKRHVRTRDFGLGFFSLSPRPRLQHSQRWAEKTADKQYNQWGMLISDDLLDLVASIESWLAWMVWYFMHSFFFRFMVVWFVILRFGPALRFILDFYQFKQEICSTRGGRGERRVHMLLIIMKDIGIYIRR